MADSLEGSDFTSIQARLEQAAKCKRHKQRQTAAKALLPFSDQVPVEQAAAALGATDVSAETSSGANGVSSDRDTIPDTSRDVSAETSGGGMHTDAGRDPTGRRILPMTFSAYGELLEWVGRAMHAKANGRIRGCPPAILTDLGLDSEAFLTALTQQRLAHATALGTPGRMEAQAQARGRAWLRGKQLAQDLTKPARGHLTAA